MLLEQEKPHAVKLWQGIGQYLDQMPSSAARAVSDLLAAGDAGGHNLACGVPGLDGGKQATIPDGQGHLVMFLLVPEGTGHAAAAGVHFIHLGPQQETEHLKAGTGAGQGFLVAMAVEQHGWRSEAKRQI